MLGYIFELQLTTGVCRQATLAMHWAAINRRSTVSSCGLQ